jgi:hypothetical protein
MFTRSREGANGVDLVAIASATIDIAFRLHRDFGPFA